MRINVQNISKTTLNNRLRTVGASLCALLIIGVLNGAPARPPISDRVQNSSVIVVGQLSDVETQPFSEVSRAVSMTVTVSERLKGDAPDQFHLGFLVFPETFENHMREPVNSGTYILFLNRKTVQNDAGQSGTAIVLYEPRAFAFLEYNESNLSEVQLYLN